MDGENTEWKEPSPPGQTPDAAEQPQMSEVATLGNIFIEPGNTFEDLRRKTRWVLALLVTVFCFSASQILFFEKVGFEKAMTGILEGNSRVQKMPPDQKAQFIEMQTSPLAKKISYIVSPILLLLGLFIGALFYWGGANAMGGRIGYFKSLSVFVYSTFAPWVVWIIANTLVLFLKNVNEIELINGQPGLIHANPNLFLNLKGSPGLSALMGSFDLFVIWGLVLAAIGLQKIAKLSAGAAWAAVLFAEVIFVALKVGWFYINA